MIIDELIQQLNGTRFQLSLGQIHWAESECCWEMRQSNYLQIKLCSCTEGNWTHTTDSNGIVVVIARPVIITKSVHAHWVLIEIIIVWLFHTTHAL